MQGLQKKMSDFRRQHPVAALSRAFGLIRGNFVTILVFLFVGARSDSFPFFWWIGGGAVFLLIAGLLNWWRFLYKIEDDTLHIKSGIFVRKDLYLTKDRVQVIDTTAGIIQRIFGLVRLDIQTAGSSSRQAAIEAITAEQAAIINNQLRNKKNGNGQETEVSEQDTAQPELLRSIKLPNKELFIAASTSGSFGIALSLIATVFSQIEPILSESQLYDDIINLLPSETNAMVIGATLLVFVIFAWLISFFSTVLTYGNFQIDVKEDELVVSRGIFEKKRITVPFNRIQAIHVTEGLIRQPLGYASIHLESAGYGDEKGSGSFVLFPLIKTTEILALLEKTVPDYFQTAQSIRPPAKALRRYIIRSSFAITLATAVTFFWFDLNLFIWLLPVLSVLWGWLRYKAAAAGKDPQFYILRSRFFSRSTAFIRTNRVQDITVRQSFFQRMRALCTITIYVASGDHGKSFSVTDLDLEKGKALLKSFKTKKFHFEDSLLQDTPYIPDWPSNETLTPLT